MKQEEKKDARIEQWQSYTKEQKEKARLYWKIKAEEDGQIAEIDEATGQVTLKKKQTIGKLLYAKNHAAASIQDFLSNNPKRAKPIIHPFIPKKSIITIWGNPATAKSIVADYIAACVASGKKFLNRYKAEKLSVLILACENGGDIENMRLRATLRGMNICWKRRRKENLQLHILTREKVSIFSDAKFYENLKEQIRNLDVKLLIIDTLSPMILDTNDNSANEIVKTYNEYLFPLIDEFGLSILMVMHSQKTGYDFLGSIKHKANADNFYELVRNDEDNTLSLLCHKGRFGEHNLKMGINFQSKNDELYKINFNYLDEWQGKQSANNKDNNPAKNLLVRELILKSLKDKELQFKEIMTICFASGYTTSTSKRAINFLYEARKIAKKQGKTGGYYLL